MVLIVLFLPFFIVSELRRANKADNCYFFFNVPDTSIREKYFRARTFDFSHPLLQYNTGQPAVGILEVSLSVLTGLASSLLASCTNRKKKKWQPKRFKFEMQFGDVAYCSNPHPVSIEGDHAIVDFNHKIAFQVVRDMVPELHLKVYGCRINKVTHGVKVKAVLGTASINLGELLSTPEAAVNASHMSESLSLLRENGGGREQGQLEMHLTYR
jgi:hypothetical protein